MNNRDINRELVLHGGEGNRNAIEAPLNFVKNTIIPKQEINDCLEVKITKQLSKKWNSKNYDKFGLNNLFGLKNEKNPSPKCEH